jgi:hypothetical protein
MCVLQQQAGSSLQYPIYFSQDASITRDGKTAKLISLLHSLPCSCLSDQVGSLDKDVE